MARFILGNLLFLAVAGTAFAAVADIEKHPSCAYCGMDRTSYAHSRMLIEYDDGSSFGACSLHCAAIDLAGSIDKTPERIEVGDYDSRQLIDAEKAFWVIGGRKPGVMTSNPKWAFETRLAAENFIKDNGGRLATFEASIKAAYEDMYQDTRHIRDRRKMKRSHNLK